MKYIINKIFDDPSGAIFSFLDDFMVITQSYFSTIYMKVILKSRGIKFGFNCSFYGKSHFRRYFKSTITIGNDCRFRSSFISNKVGLNRPCFISTLQKDAQIIIGNNVGLSGTVIGCAELINIGNNVLLGGNTFITDTDWHSLKKDTNKAETKPVIIEDDVFIGLNTIVLKGSQIGKGSIIGANSVVSGKIPANVIAAGNPCKIIKEIDK